MQTARIYLIGWLLLCAIVCRVEAQSREELATPCTVSDTRIHTTQAEIHFRWDRSELDTAYMGNGRALAQLDRSIQAIGKGGGKVDSVVILSQSSPEGTFRHNQKLSMRRAATMRRYMEQHYPTLTSRLRVTPDGESWLQLRELVRTDTRLKNSSIARVLGIIDDNTISIDTKKWRITHDPVYRYLYRTYYPQIRNSMICVVYYRTETAPVATTPVSPDAIWKAPMRTATLPKISPAPQQHDTLTVALKTNLLYDAVTALNVEIEVPIGAHWSVVAEDLFPWWEHGNKYCFQIWEMGIEGRYWFRENRYHNHKLRGWFVGPYVMSGKYDLQWKNDLNYQGEFWSAGATAGYAMPISKRLNLEFSLSVGYLSTAYRHYFHAADYSELFHDGERGRTGYFGPTKVKVSLVWPLHLPYKKGGRR